MTEFICKFVSKNPFIKKLNEKNVLSNNFFKKHTGQRLFISQF